jgi:hypothetical protein
MTIPAGPELDRIRELTERLQYLEREAELTRISLREAWAQAPTDYVIPAWTRAEVSCACFTCGRPTKYRLNKLPMCFNEIHREKIELPTTRSVSEKTWSLIFEDEDAS